MKKMILLAIAAAVLCTAAWFLRDSRKMKTPKLVGKKVLASFDLSEVAKIECGGDKKLALASTDAGWVISSLYGYPADITKIRENILKLQELKVGDVARGKQLKDGKLVDLQDASGKSLVSLTLGDKHEKRSSGDSPYGGGGYPDGRYVQAGGAKEVVLVKETLDAFDGDPKQWTETQIASVSSSDLTAIQITTGKQTLKLDKKDGAWTIGGLATNEEFNTSNVYGTESALSYLNFASVADPKLAEPVLGFETGTVYTVQTKNGQTYTAHVGAKVKDGTDRYVKLSASFSPVGTNTVENAKYEQQVKDFNAKNAKWVYTVASYSAENMTKGRADFVKAKEEPKKSETEEKK